MRFDGREDQLEMLREITENLQDPVFLVDRMLNVWYHNTAFELAVGIRMTSRRYKGLSCKELLGLDICSRDCVMKRAIETGQVVRLAEIHGNTAGGEERRFQVVALPVLNSAGNPLGALVFLRDMTVEVTVHNKYKRLVEKNASISLSGQIESGGLPDVIQLISFLKKTGALEVKAAGNEGEIIFQSGKVMSVRAGKTWSEKALGRMLTWAQGTFEFIPRDAAEVGQLLEVSGDHALMDALREQDEVGHRRPDIPDPGVIPTVIGFPENDTTNELERKLIALAQGGATVTNMMETLDSPDNRIYLALLALRDRKALYW